MSQDTRGSELDESPQTAVLRVFSYWCFISDLSDMAKLREEKERLRVRVREHGDMLRERTTDSELKPVVVVPGHKIEKFRDRPERSSDTPVREWVADIRSQAEARRLSKQEFSAFVLSNLGGKARQELMGRGEEIRNNPDEILQVLLTVFGDDDRLPLLQQRFYAYKQTTEDLLTCSLELVDIYDRITEKDPTFKAYREPSLKGRFTEAVRDENLRRELRRLNEELPGLSFFELRDRAIRWFGTSKPRNVVACQEATVDPIAKALEAQGQQLQQQQQQINDDHQGIPRIIGAKMLVLSGQRSLQKGLSQIAEKGAGFKQLAPVVESHTIGCTQ